METIMNWDAIVFPSSVSYLFEECFLSLAICGQILLSLRPKVATATLEKHQFFVLLRYTQGCLLIAFLCTGLKMFYLSNMPDLMLLHAGNFFFRSDLLTLGVALVLTGLAFHYIHNLMAFFARTNQISAYVAELPILVLTAVLSVRFFIATNDLMLMVIGLEIAAFCSVILIGMQSCSKAIISFPLEAALKYFAINALAVTFLISAIAGYYAVTATVNLVDISAYFLLYPYLYPFIVSQFAWCQLIFFFSYLIKMGAVPFHHWVADVYEGAETIITTFLVLIISPAISFKLLCLFNQLIVLPENPGQRSTLVTLFVLCGIGSIVLGTFNAFYQTRIKRFIAYAGITHLGFMLLGLGCQTLLGTFSFLIYLIVYVVTNLGFFTLLLQTQHALRSNVLVYFHQLKAVFQTNPAIFFSFLVFLLSFAGLPPFAGFFGKAFILLSLIDTAQYILVLGLLGYILIGAYMYLRIFKIALFETAMISFFATLQNFRFYQISGILNTQQTIGLSYYGSLVVYHVYWVILALGGFCLVLPVCGQWLFLLSVTTQLIF